MRPSWDVYFMAISQVIKTRGTCARRQVGCVLINSNKLIIGTGFNGTARGQPHCVDNPCAGANLLSGQGLDICEAIHAEANALVNCRNAFEIDTAYVTTSPCVSCVKLLLGTSCKRIIFAEEYNAPGAKEMWINSGREWIKI